MSTEELQALLDPLWERISLTLKCPFKPIVSVFERDDMNRWDENDRAAIKLASAVSQAHWINLFPPIPTSERLLKFILGHECGHVLCFYNGDIRHWFHASTYRDHLAEIRGVTGTVAWEGLNDFDLLEEVFCDGIGCEVTDYGVLARSQEIKGILDKLEREHLMGDPAPWKLQTV